MEHQPHGKSKSRAVALALGLTIALPAAWFAIERFRAGTDTNTVRLVDRSEEVQRLLRQRQVTPAPEAESGISTYDSDESFRHSVLPERIAEMFYSSISDQRQVYDPVMSSRLTPNQRLRRKMWEHPRKGWVIRTNSFGLSNDEEPAVPAPSLRIVVTGDSHIEGVCSNAENLCNQLALRLRAAGIEDAEVLNSGVGGYNIYNYVGVVEARANLAPDLYVVIVFGGNDFSGAMYIQYFQHKRGAPEHLPWNARWVLKSRGDRSGVMGQELFQAMYFLNNPEDEELAVQTATSACMEMNRLAEAAGARILFVYLPPPFTGQPELYAEERDEHLKALRLPPDCVEVSNRIADGWLANLRERELEVVDLRAAFAGADEPLYWRADHHINLTAHALIAEILEPVVRALADPRR